VDAPSLRAAVETVVEAYQRDDDLDELATYWPPNSGELVAESLTALVEQRYDWYSDGR